MILLIKHKVDWELIHQQKQMQINKYNIHKNIKQIDHGYEARDKVMLNNHDAYKYETSYKGSFLITQCWTNGTVTIQYGATKSRHNIRCIKPYKFDTNVEYITTENIYDDVKILSPVIYLCILLKLGHKVYTRIYTVTLTYIQIHHI